jgi:phenylacetate-CoA ligase
LAKTIYHILGLRKNQWRPKEELEKLQLKKLEAMVKHAYHNVPFYHDLYKKNKVKPEDIKTLKDIEKLPVITKADVIDNFPQNITCRGTEPEKCTVRRTSGSTGIPLKVLEDPVITDYSNALVYYSFFEMGLRLRDRFTDITYPPFNKSWLHYSGLFNKHFVPIPEPAEENIQKLREINPQVLYAGPPMLTLYGKIMQEQGIKDVNPRIAITHGATLFPEARKLIENAFNTEVFDTYGSMEFMRLAFECQEHNGLHAVSDAAIMEFLKDDEKVAEGEQGEIVATSLYSYTMPLIRYQLDDLGSFTEEKCSCGRTHPLIKEVSGRKDDFCVLPSGKIISWYLFYRGLITAPGVRQYQILQERKNDFKVLIVEGQGFNENSIQQIEETIRNGCQGEPVYVKVKTVEKIPCGRTGKPKTFASKVKLPGLNRG